MRHKARKHERTSQSPKNKFVISRETNNIQTLNPNKENRFLNQRAPQIHNKT